MDLQQYKVWNLFLFYFLHILYLALDQYYEYDFVELLHLIELLDRIVEFLFRKEVPMSLLIVLTVEMDYDGKYCVNQASIMIMAILELLLLNLVQNCWLHCC